MQLFPNASFFLYNSLMYMFAILWMESADHHPLPPSLHLAGGGGSSPAAAGGGGVPGHHPAAAAGIGGGPIGAGVGRGMQDAAADGWPAGSSG